MIDRYTKIVLTVIAGALVYLCVVMTALPAVQAQMPSKSRANRAAHRSRDRRVENRAGHRSRLIGHPVQVTASKPLPITGQVTTERASDKADRVVLVGWEEGAARRHEAFAVNTQAFDGSPSRPELAGPRWRACPFARSASMQPCPFD